MDLDLAGQANDRAGSCRAGLELHQSVRLEVDVETWEGRFTKGRIGAVVFCHPDSGAYEIEFFEPLPGVVTLREGQVTPV